jgi:hypothetical protein
LSNTDLDPRERIGGNNPPIAALIAGYEGDFAADVTRYLNEAYGKHETIIVALLGEAAALVRDPETGELKPIEDAEKKGKVASLIKRIRDEAKALEAIHAKEKNQYLRGGQAVDQRFFGWIDKLARRDKKNRAGAADVLGEMLTTFDTMVLEQERERLRKIAAEAARKAQEEQDAADKLAREARLRQEEADRARKPEIVEQKQEKAAEVATEASTAKVGAAIAAGQAEAAHVDTLKKPADIMRTRGDDGTMTTMATEPYAVVEDRTKLDFIALKPHFSLDAIEKAYRAWAKSNDYSVQMEGGKCGRKPKSVVK